MDNRLVLATEEQLHETWMQQFTDLGFYGNQIRLEKVDDHSWLGFTIDAASRSIQYKVPIGGRYARLLPLVLSDCEWQVCCLDVH